MAKRLTALAVANLKPRAARYEVPDGSSGLRVVVQPSGARGWCVYASGGRTGGRPS